MDSAHSFESVHSDINISSPIMPPTPPLQETPSLGGYAQNPVLPNPPPPSTQSYNPPVHEDYYDVPVLAPYVSVSPSQVSLVSNGSHNSSESTTSSTRSASPQLSRSGIPPHHPYPLTNGTHPQMTPYTHQSHYQSPAHQFTHTSNDLPFVNRMDMTPSAMKYVPATLPRPRKDTPKPVPPKPRKVMSQDVPSYGQNQNSPQRYQKPFVRQSSLPEQDPNDEEDDDNLSAFALALKQKKLRKTVRVSDRSVPRV